MLELVEELEDVLVELDVLVDVEELDDELVELDVLELELVLDDVEEDEVVKVSEDSNIPKFIVLSHFHYS